MRLHQYTAIATLAFLTAIALICVSSAVRAQRKDTISALAEMTSAGGVAASAPFTLVIERLSTDAEREALLQAVKKDGTDGARQFLSGREATGTLQLGARTVDIKFAFARPLSGGRLITVVASDPIVFLGAGVPNAKPTTTYDLAFAMIEVSDTGMGHGELVPAGKVRLDEKGGIITEAYTATDVVRLTNVVAK